MNRALIDLLAYPRWLALSQIDRGSCPHAGYYADGDPQCKECELRQECEWLNAHNEFIGLSRRSEPELMQALDFAIDLVRAHCVEHNTRACLCDGCEWLRNAQRFVRQHAPTI